MAPACWRTAACGCIRDGGFVDVQPTWVYFFSAGRLIRAEAFMSREGALAAIREFNAED